MSDALKKCDFAILNDDDLIGCDRFVFSGRRGTGKSTAIKRWVATGKNVVWISATKARAVDFPKFFVPPAVASALPAVELTAAGECPEFSFGKGAVVVLPRSMIEAVRDTGLSVNGKQADAVICDELIKPSGRYVRNEPEYLDDLAGTLGRSGKRPVIVCACNPLFPRENAQPYAYHWRADFGAEGDYTDRKGWVTRIRGTAECADCFGEKIGEDAAAKKWAPHLDGGGVVVTVNGLSIRCRKIGGGLYVGLSEDRGDVFMTDGRYTAVANTGRGARFLTDLSYHYGQGTVVFDGFEAQMRFYELIRAK